MSHVTVVWSVAAAAALLLGLVHGLVWAMDRRAWGNLAFAVAACAVAGIAYTEVGMMYSRSPAEWAEWVRWCQLPIFFATAATVLFVRLYLGTGRWWLAWTIIAARLLILVRNFSVDPNFNFAEVRSLDQVRLLGENIAVVGDAVTGSWQWIASATTVLFLAFVVDAAMTLWRQGDRDSRRKAILVGGSITAFVAFSVGQTQLMIWGLTRTPVMIALPFLLTLVAMAFQLSADIIRAPRLARELGESERRLELAASAAGLGLWAWDIAAGRIWATDRARALFGLVEGGAFGRERWIENVHPKDVERVSQAMHAALASGTEYQVEYRVLASDGAVRWIAARARCEWDAGGTPALMRGVVRDVTAQKAAQDESDELRREVAHAGRVTMLGQLASALAHELSQPLAAILRNAEAAEMMLRRPDPDLVELRLIMADIHRDDQRAGEVIERMRELFKRRHLDFQPIPVDGLIEDVSTLVRAEAAAKRVALQCLVASGLPPVSGDRVHLSQVLINLIINGLDSVAASRQPRGAVTVAARSMGERSIEVAVTDSGTGIAPELLTRLFKPFVTTKAGGMGMGLAVSRTIIEAHGGRLWAENNDGAGATFRFTLPVMGGNPQ